MLSLSDAHQIFNLHEINDVFWNVINEIVVSQYLSDNIDRILTVIFKTHQTSEAFLWMMIDQILVFAMYEKMYAQISQQWASSSSEDSAVWELQYETQFQRQIIYREEIRLLSEYVNYMIWYESHKRFNLVINLIIIKVKKNNFIDSCLDQLSNDMHECSACL